MTQARDLHDGGFPKDCNSRYWPGRLQSLAAEEPIRTTTFEAYVFPTKQSSIDQRGAEGPDALQILVKTRLEAACEE